MEERYIISVTQKNDPKKRLYPCSREDGTYVMKPTPIGASMWNTQKEAEEFNTKTLSGEGVVEPFEFSTGNVIKPDTSEHVRALEKILTATKRDKRVTLMEAIEQKIKELEALKHK